MRAWNRLAAYPADGARIDSVVFRGHPRRGILDRSARIGPTLVRTTMRTGTRRASSVSHRRNFHVARGRPHGPSGVRPHGYPRRQAVCPADARAPGGRPRGSRCVDRQDREAHGLIKVHHPHAEEGADGVFRRGAEGSSTTLQPESPSHDGRPGCRPRAACWSCWKRPSRNPCRRSVSLLRVLRCGSGRRWCRRCRTRGVPHFVVTGIPRSSAWSAAKPPVTPSTTLPSGGTPLEAVRRGGTDGSMHGGRHPNEPASAAAAGRCRRMPRG